MCTGFHGEKYQPISHFCRSLNCNSSSHGYVTVFIFCAIKYSMNKLCLPRGSQIIYRTSAVFSQSKEQLLLDKKWFISRQKLGPQLFNKIRPSSAAPALMSNYSLCFQGSKSYSNNNRVNPFSVRIDFRQQNLTSDIRKSVLKLKE